MVEKTIRREEVDALEETQALPTIEGCTSNMIKSLFLFSKEYPAMTVIVTNGMYPTIHATKGNICYQEVKSIPSEEIIDSVGPGDAFTAGFLVHYLTDKTIPLCIKLGHELAAEILKVPGVPFDLPFRRLIL